MSRRINSWLPYRDFTEGNCLRHKKSWKTRNSNVQNIINGVIHNLSQFWLSPSGEALIPYSFPNFDKTFTDLSQLLKLYNQNILIWGFCFPLKQVTFLMLSYNRWKNVATFLHCSSKFGWWLWLWLWYCSLANLSKSKSKSKSKCHLQYVGMLLSGIR